MQDEFRINREHKDRLFRRIFHRKEDLLSLYNALNNSDYTNAEELQIYTMEDFVYMGMRNDLSFLIDMTLNVFEHQSTYNPNMPLRGFFYMSSAYQKYIALNHLDIYSSKPISLPLPQYYVFYNGTDEKPDESILHLTDSMLHPDAAQKSSAQFTAHMININSGHSSGIMKRCPKLYQYSLFIEEIRQNQKQGSTLRDAISTAVDSCIQQGILTDILLGNKAEVTNMILQEYDEDLHIRNEKEISYQDGFEEGCRISQDKIIMEKKRADSEKQRADDEKQRADGEKQRADEAEKIASEEKRRSSILSLKLQGKSDVEIAETLQIPLGIVQQALPKM